MRDRKVEKGFLYSKWGEKVLGGKAFERHGRNEGFFTARSICKRTIGVIAIPICFGEEGIWNVVHEGQHFENDFGEELMPSNTVLEVFILAMELPPLRSGCGRINLSASHSA